MQNESSLWTVLGPGKKRGYRRTYLCSCKCGTVKEVYEQNLLNKKSLSCGCTSRLKRTGHQGIMGTYWTRLQCDARRRNLVFEISIEHAWRIFESQGGLCALSGLPIRFANSAKELWNGLNTSSLDRIDPAYGYIFGNVQWVHKEVNRLKSDFTEVRLLQLCEKIHEYSQQSIGSGACSVS